MHFTNFTNGLTHKENSKTSLQACSVVALNGPTTHIYLPIDWIKISQMIHLLCCMALKGMDVTGTNPIKS